MGRIAALEEMARQQADSECGMRRPHAWKSSTVPNISTAREKYVILECLTANALRVTAAVA